jgi:hypothetical protein
MICTAVVYTVQGRENMKRSARIEQQAWAATALHQNHWVDISSGAVENDPKPPTAASHLAC